MSDDFLRRLERVAFSTNDPLDWRRYYVELRRLGQAPPSERVRWKVDLEKGVDPVGAMFAPLVPKPTDRAWIALTEAGEIRGQTVDHETLADVQIEWARCAAPLEAHLVSVSGEVEDAAPACKVDYPWLAACTLRAGTLEDPEAFRFPIRFDRRNPREGWTAIEFEAPEFMGAPYVVMRRFREASLRLVGVDGPDGLPRSVPERGPVELRPHENLRFEGEPARVAWSWAKGVRA